MDLFRRSGWMKVFRTERERDLRFAEAERWRGEFGINFAALDRKQVQEKEPHVAPVLEGALHWTDPLAVVDPQALALATCDCSRKLGGRFVQGNAATLEADGGGWRVRTERRAARRARRRRGAGTVGRRGYARAGLRPAARGEARLSHALPRRGPRGAQPPDARHRARLLPRADAPRHPPDHRRGVRVARRDEDAGAARTAPSRSRASCFRSAIGSTPIRGWARARARRT